MKCLFINTHYKTGGAALAASRLADELEKLSTDIRWYVKNSSVSDENINLFERKLKDRVTSFLYKGRVTYSPYIFSTREILRKEFCKGIDLLHFHNLHGDYFNYNAIPYISRNIPAVWTLHDMWSFTGHCAYSKQCNRWETGCGDCPDLLEYPAVKIDNTRSEWENKRKSIRKSNLHIVTPSRWLGQLAGNSFLSQHPVSVIPYGLDTDCFSPKDKKAARRQIGADEKTFTILLCSADLSDPRKPQSVLCEAINEISSQKGFPVQVITFGNGSIRGYLNPDVVIHEFGYVDSEPEKADLFSAADVFLFASRADNLPLVIQESLSCGTPVIANRVGGVPEMVIEGETGWLVQDLDAISYAGAIEEAFLRVPHRMALASLARDHAVKHYSLVENAKKYRDIYNRLLQSR